MISFGFAQGIWAGMIFGGVAVQTLILAGITIQCDWHKEVPKKGGGDMLFIFLIYTFFVCVCVCINNMV